ncbi:hypothetical protein OKA06_03240 [Novosphingobium sp. MW5]|nr:hypothetical protein [Novosphingobium sp. MW5]
MIALALLMAAAPAQEPRAVERYVDCVKAGMMKPDEDAETYDQAVDLAKSACGNLRPEAIGALKKGRAKELAKAGDDAEDAAQVLLDGMADGVAAKIWAAAHPGEADHVH